MVLARALIVAVALLGVATPARAQRATTRDALERLEEVLQMRLNDGSLRRDALAPSLLVAAEARYEASLGWFATESLSILTSVVGPKDVRMCTSCMQPRVFSEPGRLEHSAGALSLDEIKRLDAAARGKSPAARTAVWISEHRSGVAIKIVELSTARVLFADNIDPDLRENKDTKDMMRMGEELERRARGDSLTHTFIDAVLFPSQHVSLDWTDQWGDSNENFTGLSLSLFDPIIGIGMAYYRVIHVFHVAGFPVAPQVGAKLFMSLPTALVQSIAPDDTDDLPDPLLRGMVVVRIPFGRSNYGLIASGSLNLSNFGDSGLNPSFGIGISLLNISLLPVLP